MSAPFRGFPNPVQVLVNNLQTLAGATDRTGNQTPADFTGRLPFIRIIRIGGGSDNLDDRSTVEIDVFDSTYTAAVRLAEQVRQYLVGPPPGPWQLDKVICDAGPRELPWANTDVRRLGATYGVVARRLMIA